VQLERERQKSEKDANLLMQKWLYDETMLPNLWEPFLWGSTNDLKLTGVSTERGIGERIYNSVLVATDAARKFLAK